MSAWESIGKSDEWYTPKYIFDALGTHFDTDVAAAHGEFNHVPADRLIFADSLTANWIGFCWMNPPFGGRNEISKWLDKMHEHGNGIALTPDRTSVAWWQKAFNQSQACLFIAGKVKFIRPDGSIGGSPSTGTTLFAYGDKAMKALHNADKAGLGIAVFNMAKFGHLHDFCVYLQVSPNKSLNPETPG